ncbi:MAG: hypothetical protein HND51_24345 [Chloroflexi bacterium]|nr:hypothetical protein [Chloroflexota bacterium]
MNTFFVILLIIAVPTVVVVSWHAVWAVLRGRQHLEIQDRFNQATAPGRSSSRSA